jgi:hypothetical protein
MEKIMVFKQRLASASLTPMVGRRTVAMRLVSAVQGRRMARSAAACRSRERYDSGDNLLVPRRVGGRCDGAQLRVSAQRQQRPAMPRAEPTPPRSIRTSVDPLTHLARFCREICLRAPK